MLLCFIKHITTPSTRLSYHGASKRIIRLNSVFGNCDDKMSCIHIGRLRIIMTLEESGKKYLKWRHLATSIAIKKVLGIDIFDEPL